MQTTRFLKLAARCAIAGLAFGAASNASAANTLALGAIVYPAASATMTQSACLGATPGSRPVRANDNAIVLRSKNAALPGGELSALERMKQQQSGNGSVPMRADATQTAAALTPAASGWGVTMGSCALSSKSRFVPAVQSAPTGTPHGDFLGSTRVQISKTSFDADWRRVSSESLSGSSAISARRADTSFATIKAVNGMVNRQISYVEDRDLFGHADYWAGAIETMALGKGDCEDIALTKMHLLSAAGFRSEDMFLTIVRDTIKQVDHALLIVKIDDGYVVLDNATDVILDGAYSHAYKPVLTFSQDRAWIHGY